ncbi:GFA family protein [Ruegeria discodermiae]|uniref:GFA family protein n=1 Tax=Ruegeria discodermiae TaxID=3064389 RepID=UPI00353206BD
MTDIINGGCACGAVRYECRAKIEFSFNCHCRKCQRATGGGHSSAFAIPKVEFKVSGIIREFASPSDNGAITYAGFCPECGSPLTSRTERFPERIYVHAATLDDPSKFCPAFVVYGEMAQPWDAPHEHLSGA